MKNKENPLLMVGLILVSMSVVITLLMLVVGVFPSYFTLLLPIGAGIAGIVLLIIWAVQSLIKIMKNRGEF